ncbi:hypothetical protein H6G97_37560 [Nostoc flagelliforme FACHB-838]|uniref:Uncharacterized protein n=1 Tax=Nostoc flagelliforme FACHB-838 TaxID=2692904 RepID=A0ABR8E060_9NOSO|nr:hypothetical protein [Nostoc flagelliforme]MBD2534848.1 hypothetical protein [Nostoc flagelliforme FACHB-838]
MKVFSEALFKEAFDFSELEQIVTATIRLAVSNPIALYIFLQYYIYFNGYASSVISRLVSSVAMSRYLFTDPEILVTEEADRGFQISAEIMVAASDEGAYGITHRELAQLMLRTAGNYAKLSTKERNQFSQVPLWLDEIVQAVMAGYQGTPDNAISLIRSIGFHAASEMLGDREYALLDMIVRYENQEFGFDRYLKQQTTPVPIRGHRYDPWCYVVIHGKHEGSGAEARHFDHVLEALNMVVRYRPESEQQILQWVLEGYQAFVYIQQSLFREIYRECLQLIEASQIVSL